MSNTGNHFRTVMFGGFHKQDVLNYITQASMQHQERDAGLIQSAEQMQAELDALTEKYENAEAARKKNAADCERMSEALSQRTIELEEVMRELNALKAEHERASARLAEVEEVLPELQEGAQAYAELKDHTATIEMEAHRKAQQILDQAQEKSARIRSDLEEWMRRVNNAYQRLRTDVSATVSHVSGELERGLKALNDAAPAFRQHDETLNALLVSEGVADLAEESEHSSDVETAE